MIRHSFIRLTVLLSLALMLAGCSMKDLFVSKAPAKQYYTLPTVDVATNHPDLLKPPQSANTVLQLLIEEPQTGPGLATDRIVLLKSSHELDTYARARWIAPLPQLIHAQLRGSFENVSLQMQTPWLQIVEMGRGLAPDNTLWVDVPIFQAEYQSEQTAPVVHIKMVVKLVDTDLQQIIYNHAFEVYTPARENTLDAVSEAWTTAFADIEAQVVVGVLTTLNPR